MLTLAVAVPIAGALLLASWQQVGERGARTLAFSLAVVPLILLIATWSAFDTGSDMLFQRIEEVEWIPTLGVAWRLGVDGIALPLAAMSALLFAAAIAWPVDTRQQPRAYYAWFLFLEGVTLGVFLALDLLLFYVFFDLSLVGMYFLIGRWGHADARKAALKFLIYTLAGSLTLLLGILALCLGTDPLSFDMRVLIAEQPLAGTGLTANLVLLAILVGLAIKTPLFPFHTWLPPAHVEAPAPASAILAGVLLKIGTFGLIRIPYMMLAETFRRYAFVLAVIAVVSILYGALVALGQSNLKRRIAYTSVNHMGYTVLGIAAAAALLPESETARRLALTGATVEMIAHGLITGSLFLITGAFWQRTKDYELSGYGGLAGRAPKLRVLMTIAAFASFGMPGLAGFVAEFQIFVGTFGVYPWLAAVGLLGILITAALFLQMLQALFYGKLPPSRREFQDLDGRETLPLALLVLLIIVIGVYPRWLLDVIDGTARLLTVAS